MIVNELEAINELIQLLNKPDQVIIVEGKKDVTSLKEIGVTSEIYSLNNGKPIYERIEEIIIKEKKVVILTDFDIEGENLKKIIYEGINNQAIILNEPRNLLKKTQVSHIEGLNTRYERLKSLEKF